MEKHQEVRFFLLSHSFAFTNNFPGLKWNKGWWVCGNKQNNASNVQIGNFTSAELVLLKMPGRFKWKNECNYSVWMDGSAQHVLRKVNCLNIILKFGFCPLCTKVCKIWVVFLAKLSGCHFGGCKLVDLSLSLQLPVTCKYCSVFNEQFKKKPHATVVMCNDYKGRCCDKHCLLWLSHC